MLVCYEWTILCFKIYVVKSTLCHIILNNMSLTIKQES